MGCYFHTHVLVYRNILVPSADCWLIVLLFSIPQRFSHWGAIELWGIFTAHESTLTLKLGSQVLVKYYFQFRVLDKRIYFFSWTKIVADRHQTHDLPHKALGGVKGRGCTEIDINRFTLPYNDFRSVLVSKRKNLVLYDIFHDAFK